MPSSDVKTETLSDTGLLALPLKREQDLVASLSAAPITRSVQKELEHLAQIVFSFDNDFMNNPGQGSNSSGAGGSNNASSPAGRGRSTSSGPSKSRGGSRSQSASGSGGSSINRASQTEMTLPPLDVFDHAGYRAFQSLVGPPPPSGHVGRSQGSPVDSAGSLNHNSASRQFAFQQPLPGISPLNPPAGGMDSYPWMAYPTYSNQMQRQAPPPPHPSHFPMAQYSPSTAPLQPPLGFGPPSTDMNPYTLLLPNASNPLPSALQHDPFAAQMQQLQQLQALAQSGSSSRGASSPVDSTSRGEGSSTGRSRASTSRAPAARTRTLSTSSAGRVESVEAPANSDDVLDDKRRRNTAASARFRIKKKQHNVNLERTVSDLQGRAEELEKEAAELRRENGWLKEIVILRGRVGTGRVRVGSNVTGAASQGTPQEDTGVEDQGGDDGGNLGEDQAEASEEEKSAYGSY